jgi:hypothetical protein
MCDQASCATMLRISGYGLVVERVLAKDETGVRFSLAALQIASRGFSDLSQHSLERILSLSVAIQDHL